MIIIEDKTREAIVYIPKTGKAQEPKPSKMTITENGLYDIVGRYNINVDVNIQSGCKVVLPNGTKFRTSTFSTLPEGFDFSNITDFAQMFLSCINLTSVSLLDTSKGTYFSSMFEYCRLLTTIPQLDVSKGTRLNSMFSGCRNLTDVTFVGSINDDIDFSSCTKLTYESIKSILTACSATTNTDAKTLKFNITLTDNNGELAALVTTCTSKGWTISGLTLN